MQTAFEKRVARNERAAVVDCTRRMIEQHRKGEIVTYALLSWAERLLSEVVNGKRCLLQLIGDYARHGYRPTLRGDVDPRAIAVADLYDYFAQLIGADVRAYRG